MGGNRVGVSLQGSSAHPMGYGAHCSPLSDHRGAAGALLAPGGFAAFLSGAACSTSPWIYGGLEGDGSIPANRVWAAVRGPCVLEGDPGHKKDKAGAEVVGTHLFG